MSRWSRIQRPNDSVFVKGVKPPYDTTILILFSFKIYFGLQKHKSAQNLKNILNFKKNLKKNKKYRLSKIKYRLSIIKFRATIN